MHKELPKLDKIDYKILACLDYNAREFSSVIAKKVKLSRTIVDYRIKKMQEQGIIVAFNAFIDPAKFNNISWKIYLRFQNLNTEKEKEILNYLKKYKKVWWVIKCAGQYDLMFCILSETIHDLYNELLEFNTLFSNFIIETELTSHIDPEFYTRGYISGKPELPSNPFLIKPSKQKFSDLEIKILKILGNNCRLPITNMARQLHSTPRIIKFHIDKLEKEEIISWYRIIIDPAKLNKEYYKTLINFKGLTKEQEKRFVNFCRNNKNIINISRAAGPWDFEFECEIENYQKYNELMQEIRKTFPELIKQYKTLLIYDQLKFENNFLEYQE